MGMRSIAAVLPRRLGVTRKAIQAAGTSQELQKAARADAALLLVELATDRDGLSQEEAERRLERNGPNAVAKEDGQTRLGLLGKALLNPLVLLLTVLATVSLLTGDARAAIVMG